MGTRTKVQNKYKTYHGEILEFHSQQSREETCMLFHVFNP